MHNRVSRSRIHKGKLVGLVVFHLIALLAPWTFTTAGLYAAIALFLLTGQLGISVGYHRLLCHGSFYTFRPLRYLFALLGVLAFQKGPLTWCALHRLHHRHADTERDPQQSHRSLLWSHVLWTVAEPLGGMDVGSATRDLGRDTMFRYMERYFIEVNAVFAAALFLAGWLTGGLSLGISLLVWGFFLRVVVCWHATFLVNSVNHRWGYRNYASRDNSRNTWWVALLSFGEGWHNNHHRYPRCAAHGHRWFEIDSSYAIIRLMEQLRLACKVIHPRSQRTPVPEEARC
jgi:stearoyl-CoA desaturase (delta-9 desaturase)